MTLSGRIKEISIAALKELYPQADINVSMVTINQTKPEFSGDYTLVLFPFVKLLRLKPDELGKQLGEHLQQQHSFIASYQVVSGFLNLSMKDDLWSEFLLKQAVNRRTREERSSEAGTDAK